MQFDPTVTPQTSLLTPPTFDSEKKESAVTFLPTSQDPSSVAPSSLQKYTFSKKIPQTTPEGVCLDIDTIVEEEEPVNDLEKYTETLAQDALALDPKVQESLRYYAQTMGYTLIKQELRSPTNGNEQVKAHIQNMLNNLRTYGFSHPVRLFHTEGGDFKQMVNGTEVTSRELRIGDTWKFPSFVSSAITNQPINPKSQNGNRLTIFVFEFDVNQDIRGLFLGKLGKEGESEFLLSPGTAKVRDTYELKIGFGYMVVRAKFVVCNILFPKAVTTKIT